MKHILYGSWNIFKYILSTRPGPYKSYVHFIDTKSWFTLPIIISYYAIFIVILL